MGSKNSSWKKGNVIIWQNFKKSNLSISSFLYPQKFSEWQLPYVFFSPNPPPLPTAWFSCFWKLPPKQPFPLPGSSLPSTHIFCICGTIDPNSASQLCFNYGRDDVLGNTWEICRVFGNGCLENCYAFLSFN